MAKIKTLKDYNDEIIYPQSTTRAIVNAEGVNLDTLHSQFVMMDQISDIDEIDTSFEETINKITKIDNTSTDLQYPSAKAVYDFVLENKEVGVKIAVVENYPTSNIDSNTIYLIKNNTTEEQNFYDEYIYVNNTWEHIGTTTVDLTNYATKNEIPTATSQLANDSDYTTKTYVDGIIPDVSGFVTKEELGSSSIPTGLICMWSGSEVPIGWLLCNGENNTPDLRDRFIVGAGNEYSIGNTGGEKEHVLTTAEMPKHQHAVGGNNESETSWDSVTTGNGYGRIAYRYSGDGSFELGADKYSSSGDDTTINYSDWLVNTTSAGSNSAHENRPPYYALAFIMKA